MWAASEAPDSQGVETATSTKAVMDLSMRGVPAVPGGLRARGALLLLSSWFGAKFELILFCKYYSRSVLNLQAPNLYAWWFQSCT